jgi:peptide subunit release factor RF-3
MSGVYDTDYLHAALSYLYETAERQDAHIKRLHGTLISIAAGVSALTELLSTVLSKYDPEGYVRASQSIESKTSDWLQMIKEVNE